MTPAEFMTQWGVGMGKGHVNAMRYDLDDILAAQREADARVAEDWGACEDGLEIAAAIRGSADREG